jgi:hypothetical protein
MKDDLDKEFYLILAIVLVGVLLMMLLLSTLDFNN